MIIIMHIFLLDQLYNFNNNLLYYCYNVKRPDQGIYGTMPHKIILLNFLQVNGMGFIQSLVFTKQYNNVTRTFLYNVTSRPFLYTLTHLGNNESIMNPCISWWIFDEHTNRRSFLHLSRWYENTKWVLIPNCT
jgi:hypothetical protein